MLEDDDGHPIDLNKLSYHLTLEFLFIEEEQYLPPASLSEKMGVPKMLR